MATQPPAIASAAGASKPSSPDCATNSPGAAALPTGETPCDAEQGVIRVRVREFSQLFNSLDPAPFLERDLDDDLVDYIESWAREIPDGRPLRLEIHIAQPSQELGDGEMLRSAVRNHFQHSAELKQNEYRELLRLGRRALLIGLAVLTTATVISNLVALAGEGQPLLSIVQESVIIGGWVAMWRPMELLLYDRWPLRRGVKRTERLVQARIDIVAPR